jgi:hypothetical protein
MLLTKKLKFGVLLMRIAILTVCISFVVALPFAHAESNLVARYCGKLWNSGKLVPAETELIISDDGLRRGYYEFVDAGKVNVGKLVVIRSTSERSWLLKWKDQYGAGTLELHFESDYRSFKGLWGTRNRNRTRHWSGRLCNK